MNDSQNQFYASLGILSVKYAQMEFLLATILGKLTGTDDDLIITTITEDNSLSKNLDLLRKLNKIVSFKEQELNSLINHIDKIRRDRNLFVHGIWGVPYESDGEIKIQCSERKIRLEEHKTVKSDQFDRTWHYNENHSFGLQEIKDRISKIDEILESQNSFIRELDIENFKL